MIPAPTPAQAALILFNLGLLAAMVAAWGWAAYRLLTGRGLLPSAKPRPVPWRGNAVLAILLTWLVLQIFVPPIYFGLAGVGRDGPEGRLKIGPGDMILVTLLVNGPIVPVGALILRRMAGATASDLGLEPRRVVTEAVRGVVAWPILAPIVFGVNFLVLRLDPTRVTHPIQQWAEMRPGGATWLVLAFSAVVAAPLAEEFLFRGVLLGWLGRRATTRPLPPDDLVEDGPDRNFSPRPPDPGTVGRRLWGANVMVSLVFAAMHAQVWPTPIPLFFFSLGLGVLYQRTGSLIAPFVLHATFNGVTTLLLFLGTISGGLDALRPGGPGPAKPPPIPAPAILTNGRILPDETLRQGRTIEGNRANPSPPPCGIGGGTINWPNSARDRPARRAGTGVSAEGERGPVEDGRARRVAGPTEVKAGHRRIVRPPRHRRATGESENVDR